MSRLKFQDLSAGYSGRPVIANVSLYVGAGITTLYGANGSGKSTLVKSLFGESTIMGGEVWLDGVRIGSDDTSPMSRNLGILLQNESVFPSLSVRRNLLIGHALPDTEASRRVDEILGMFPDLRDLLEKPAAVLSGGERRMTALGRVLVGRPSTMLLDEPSAGLSVPVLEHFLHSLSKYVEEANCTVLMIEHHIDLTLIHASQVAVMSKGRIVWAGPSKSTNVDRILDLMLDPEIESV